MFVLCKAFKPSLMFTGKAGAYPNEVPNQDLTPSIALKYKIRVEVIDIKIQ